MQVREVIASPDRFWIGEAAWDRPVAVIDLEQDEPWPEETVMPPCPVIGIGLPDAPGAALVDAVIEPPVALEATLAQVAAFPRAAATVVQLLRLLPMLAPDDGLMAESLAYAVLQGSAEHQSWKARAARLHGLSKSAGVVRVVRDGAALEVALDRRDHDNAIDRTMRDALFDAFSLAALDGSIARVILRGEGRAFSMGADLDEFGTTADPATAHAIRAVTLPARMAVRIADRLEARVHGACVGAGLEIAAFAGRVLATPKAWFQLPELAMGILPGAGGCVSVSRRIGRQRAALMILSGKRVSARRALDWGLVDAIVDDFA